MKPFGPVALYGIGEDGTVLFLSTIPTKTERLIYADRYRIELTDPFLDRRVVHTYSVKVIWRNLSSRATNPDQVTEFRAARISLPPYIHPFMTTATTLQRSAPSRLD